MRTTVDYGWGRGAGRDLTGMRFERLVVLKRAGSDKNRKRTWLCRCDCGNERILTTGSLRQQNTRSCGCWKVELARTRFITHGKTYTQEYRIWSGLRCRCSAGWNNPSKSRRYYGRGIRVCPEWDSFEQFLADMGPRPSPKHSIDRIDNNGPYSASNCRWATPIEQARNTERALRITFNNVTLTTAEWAERLGLSPRTVLRRVREGTVPLDYRYPKYRYQKQPES